MSRLRKGARANDACQHLVKLANVLGLSFEDVQQAYAHFCLGVNEAREGRLKAQRQQWALRDEDGGMPSDGRTLKALRRRACPTDQERDARVRNPPALGTEEIKNRVKRLGYGIDGAKYVVWNRDAVIAGHQTRAKRARGISQGECAGRGGISVDRYRRIEQGRADPDDEEVAALACALDVPTVEIVLACTCARRLRAARSHRRRAN